MADIVTGTVTGLIDNTKDAILSGVHESIKENLKGTYATQTAVSQQGVDISKQVDAFEDVVNSQFFTIARESADNRAQITALGYQVRDGFVAAAKDSEINALKTQIETAKQTTYLSDKIDAGNMHTQHLIHELKHADLNRMLIERNTALTEAYMDGRRWHDRADMGQWAAVHNQLQAFGSQLQETRQGVTNFGTMTGNAGRQQSTNNVA